MKTLGCTIGAAMLLATMSAARALPQESRPASKPGTATRPAPDSRAAAASRPRKLVASIERTRCVGECPAYKIEIFDDGALIYNGGEGAAIGGRRDRVLPHDQLAALRAAFSEAQFAKLADHYTNAVFVDEATTHTTFVDESGTKTVARHHGDVLAPKSLVKLEERIDEIAGARPLTGDARIEGRARKAAGGVASYGTITEIDADGVTLKCHGADERTQGPQVGERFAVARPPAAGEEGAWPAYIARARVTAVDGASRKFTAVVEHVEPGATIAANDWLARSGTQPEEEKR